MEIVGSRKGTTRHPKRNFYVPKHPGKNPSRKGWSFKLGVFRTPQGQRIWLFSQSATLLEDSFRRIRKNGRGKVRKIVRQIDARLAHRKPASGQKAIFRNMEGFRGVFENNVGMDSMLFFVS